jgi:peptidoglycan biosynthesis protein MviN/MurJ (putative lipid II flippase)
MASGGTFLGSAAGALLPFLIARWFEVGRQTDVYFLVVGAVQLVGYMLALVVESAVLPFATKSLQHDPRSLRSFALGMSRYVGAAALPVTLVGLAVIVLVLLPAAGIDGAARAQAHTLVLAVAALPVLAALSGILSASNFALDRFAFTTGTQVFRAGGGVLFAVLLGDQLGLLAVALGLTVGEALRALVLAAALPRGGGATGPDARGTGLAMLRLASPTLLASIVIAVNPIVDKTVAARVGPGAVTLIELGEKLFYIPVVLLVAAISKVSATVWARQVDLDDAALRRDFWRVQRVGAAVTAVAVVLAVVAVVLGRDLAEDFLGLEPGSAFAGVFVVYVVGLPLALAADLAGTMLIILRRTGVLPVLAVVLVVVNLVADLVGAALFGVVGIAASSTVVRLINVTVFLVVVDRHLRRRARAVEAPAPPVTSATP